MNGAWRGLGLVVAVVCLCGLVPRAGGQSGTTSYGVFGADVRPYISRSDLDVFVRVLGLKEAEQSAMYSLYEGFVDALKQEAKKVRDECEKAAEEAEALQDHKLLDPAYAKSKEFTKWSEAHEKAFVEDLKTLLTREQEQRWPIVERELRRLKRIGLGRLSGESVDLVRLVDSLPKEVRQSAGLDEILESYSNDLDRAMVARDAITEESDDEFDPLIDSDPARAEAMFARVVQARIVVREVNFRYARLLGEKLPESARQKFADDVFSKSYRRLMAETRIEKYLKQAVKLDGISPDQKREVDGLEADYQVWVKAWRIKAAPVLREQEEADRPTELLRGLGKAQPDSEKGYSQMDHSNEPMAPLRRERFEKDRAVRVRLEEVLTAAQREGLGVESSVNARFEDWTPWRP